MDPKLAQFVIKWNRTTEYWASGSWNGHIFTQVLEMSLKHIFNDSYIDNENESYFTYSLYNSTSISIFFMDVSGQFKQISWSDGHFQWKVELRVGRLKKSKVGILIFRPKMIIFQLQAEKSPFISFISFSKHLNRYSPYFILFFQSSTSLPRT